MFHFANCALKECEAILKMAELARAYGMGWLSDGGDLWIVHAAMPVITEIKKIGPYTVLHPYSKRTIWVARVH